MSRLALILLVSSLASACLDDELDGDNHFMRAASDTPIEDPSVDVGSNGGDGGAGMTPGKTVTLGSLKTFIALDRDFETFLSWTSFDLGSGQHVVDQTGHRQVYINALPQPGDTEFRVGTLIVKVLELGDDITTWQIHAMAKRGGEYNAKGAYAWEYFDFTFNEDGIPRQNWRGATAPEGESYQTTVFTADGVVFQDVPDCNTCHQSARNDAINTPALDLDRWQ